MRIDVELDDVKTGFEVLPAGDYEVEVKRAKRHKAAAGPCIKWQLHPIGGEGLAEVERPGDLFLETTLSPEHLGFVKDFLVACKFKWEKKTFDTDDVIGSTLQVSVTVGEWQGKPSNSVSNPLPL